MNEPCSSLRCVDWCLTISYQYPICILVHFALSLLCLCGGVERPLLYPLLECMSIFFSISHVRTRCHVFLAGVDPELCDHTPPLLFFIVGELCWSAATHALYLSLVSLSPRSLTPDPLQHASGTLHFPFSRVRRARSSRGLPVGPGPSRVPVRTQCRDADCVLCTNRQYVDMIAHSPPSRLSSTLSVSLTTGPLVVSQDPLRLSLGGNGVGVLTDNERYVFPPTVPASHTLRGVLGGGR